MIAPLILYGIITAAVFYLGRALYYISPFHPLYRFPGPRLAAFSSWYEFYWNVIVDGQLVFRIEELHKLYGPIVRIGPNELHINDPSFYAVLYGVGYKFNKYVGHYGFAAQSEAGIGLMDPEIHRRNRAVLGPLFSPQSVRKLDPMIRRYVSLVTTRVAKTDNKTGFYIGKIFRCLAVDVISEYAYSEGYNTLEAGDLDAPFFLGMKNIVRLAWFFNWAWPIQKMMIAMPYEWIRAVAPPDAMGVIDFQKSCEDQVTEFIKDPSKAKAKNTHATIFEVLISGPAAGGKGEAKDKTSGAYVSANALKEEAWGVLAAGTETTANTLTVGIYKACQDVRIQEKLYAELKGAFPRLDDGDAITGFKCEQLPYLTCFVKEALRQAPGVPGRLPRIVPPGGCTAAGSFIPEGTIIGMSSYLLHNNPTLFKDPEKFDPGRWAEGKGAGLDTYLVPFSRGSRGCLGISLAQAELHMTFAALFRRFKFGLHEGSESLDEWVDNFAQKRLGELLVTVEARPN